MGKLTINNMDIMSTSPLFEMKNPRTNQVILGSVIKGINSKVDSGAEKFVTAFSPEFDAGKNKIKHNGNIASLSYNGTRPCNERAFYLGDDEMDVEIKNENGSFVVKKTNGALQVPFNVISSTPNKEIIINLVLFGAGGKGGDGIFYLIGGNYGGIGGGGGAKAFYTLILENNSAVKIKTYCKTSINGRIYTSSNKYYMATCCSLTSSGGTLIVECEGGYNGLSANTRDASDNLKQGEVHIFISDQKVDGVRFILRKYNHGTKKVLNGARGEHSEFVNNIAPYFGNDEEYAGLFVNKGIGGPGHSTSPIDRGYASAGSAGYGDGGYSGGLISGNGGVGEKGGGGGGGAGKGGDGNNGGYAGFELFY